MPTKRIPTKFAPAERAGPREIARQTRLFASKDVTGLLPDAVPCMLVVVNAHRQIVYANQRFLDVLSPPRRSKGVLGRRPGEVLDCAHAFEEDGGCGTSESCSKCGALNAVLVSQSGRSDSREGRIMRSRNSEVLEMRVWTTPVEVEGERFSVFAALDITHEKRREVLERIFLHDIYNVAYGLTWYADFLEKARPGKIKEYCDSIYRLSRELIEEIDAQRTLIQAESGALTLQRERASSLQLLRSALDLYRRHPVAQDRRLSIADDAEDTTLVTDRTLLLRVLCNLVKNALEACRAGETVTAGCAAADGRVEFRVHNPGFIPREVQLQIFLRSFSTKGTGRGVGTYSIKLLTERYLQGSVSFTSSPEHGTTFTVCYPLALGDTTPPN
jgi:signal transduction histidine kinase